MTWRERFLTINWNRKLWHITGGIFATSVAFFLPWPLPFFVALGAFFWWVTVESMRRREPWFGRLFMTICGPFMRGFERRKIMGNTWFALATTIISGIFHDPILMSGALIGWTFGDPAAEIIGKLFKSPKYFDNEKSVAGSIGCFVVSFFAYAVFFKIMGTGGELLPAALTMATATTLAESFATSFTVNDNFLMPLASALALSYILI